MTYRTEQEEFWAGSFGEDYIARNRSDMLLSANLRLFAEVLTGVDSRITSVLELGASIGMNLLALARLLPGVTLDAVEINAAAAEVLRSLSLGSVTEASILGFQPGRRYDLAFTKTVLIHIHPDELGSVYDVLAKSSSRYVLIAEYYNPVPTEVTYRGHEKRLFKRDFAGELMDRHPELKLVRYGFCYHRDPQFPQDDITWFLLEKK